MALVVNNNLMAVNTARNLNIHYGKLQTSTQRLSSGLRINSAADDAAGLAIRELMRADVAALNQGVRNANDAISMIQVADGALAVIDEKLIRMKELAEQAATGTYNSIQRLMIDFEFQAMASEIERIACATDFNGIKLLDSQNTLPKGIQLNNPTTKNINTKNVINYNISLGPTTSGVDYEIGYQQVETTVGTETEEYYIEDEILYKNIKKDLTISRYIEKNEWHVTVQEWHFTGNQLCDPNDVEFFCWDGGFDGFKMLVYENQDAQDYFFNRIINQGYTNVNGRHRYDFEIDINGDGKMNMSYSVFLPILTDVNNIKNSLIVDKLNINVIELDKTLPSTRTDNSSITEKIGHISQLKSEGIKIHFGPMNDAAEDYYYIDKRDCTIRGLGLDEIRIETQDKAQNALVSINDAIVKKDQARAYYGAMQNRLENTITNLSIQAENLQASESRISDIDVATEMTNFVRNQILTQSAIAMLSQANLLPQMAMQLLRG